METLKSWRFITFTVFGSYLSEYLRCTHTCVQQMDAFRRQINGRLVLVALVTGLPLKRMESWNGLSW